MKTNETKTNVTKKLDFSNFIKNINKVDENKQLICGTKNNLQLEIAKCGLMVNANSDHYVPNDAYARLKNNSEFKLQWSKSKNQFVGFCVYICSDTHKKPLEKWFKNKWSNCIDGQRIFKSDYISLDHFNDVVNVLTTFDTYNRGVLVPNK